MICSVYRELNSPTVPSSTDRFIQQCSALSYLWASDEMAAFLRPTMDVEKSLTLMSKLNTEQTLERILEHLSVDEGTVGEFSSRYTEQINEFKAHTKKVFPVLEQTKQYLTGLVTIRKHYQHQMEKFTATMGKYEENTLAHYSTSEMEKVLLFSDPALDKVETKEKVDQISKKMLNPYQKLRFWIKEEIYDLQAILEAIECKENLDKLLAKTRTKKKQSEKNLDTLNTGKKTLTNFWKSQGSKANEITKLTAVIA